MKYEECEHCKKLYYVYDSPKCSVFDHLMIYERDPVAKECPCRECILKSICKDACNRFLYLLNCNLKFGRIISKDRNIISEDIS